MKKYGFYRSFFLLAAVMLSINLLSNIFLCIFFLHQNAQQVRGSDRVYLEVASEQLTRDMSGELNGLLQSLFLCAGYQDYILNVSQQYKNNWIACVRDMMDALEDITASRPDLLRDCAIYKRSDCLFLSAAYGYRRLGRPINQNYVHIYGIDEIDRIPTGMSLRSCYIENGQGIPTLAATAVYKFNEDCMTIFVLNEQYYYHLFYDSPLADTGDSVCVLDEGGGILFSNHLSPESAEELAERLSSLPQDRHPLLAKTLRFNQTWMECTVIRNRYTGWSLMKATPVQAVYHGAFRIVAIFTGFFLLSCAAGFAVTRRISFKAYQPLKKIADNIRLIGETENAASEYTLIEQYVDISQKQMEQFRGLVEANRVTIKERFIRYICRERKVQMSLVSEYLDMLGLSIEYLHFYAALVTFDDTVMTEGGYPYQSILKFEAIDALENRCRSGMQILACDYDEHSILLFIQAQSGERTQIIDSILQFLDHTIRQQFLISYFLALGIRVSALEEVCLSFVSALQQSRLRFYIPISQRTLYRLEGKTDSADALLPLSELIRSSDCTPESGIQILQQADKLFSAVRMGEDDCRRLLQQLADLLYRIADRAAPDMTNDFRSYIIYPQKHFWKLQEYLSFGQALLSEYAGENIGVNTTVSRIHRFIDTHLDSDLSLIRIAGHIGLNAKYISRIYKESTGENLNNYINRQRLKRAAELLRDSSLTVEEISQRVGFTSSAYFIKRFKQQFGSTPKRFRDGG